MLETLLEILKWDTPCPEVLYDEEQDVIILDWSDPAISVEIERNGIINWADVNSLQHGNDFERLKIILERRK